MSSAAIERPRSGKALPPGHYGLSALVHSEWTKLRTVRSTTWTLTLTVVLGLAISAISTEGTHAGWSTMSAASRASFDPIGASLLGVVWSQFAIGVLGVLVMSAEYGTGTIRATFAAAPRRPLVLAAKAVAFGAVALVISEVVAFTSFLLGQAMLSGPVTHATLASPGALRAVIGSGLYLGAIGLFSLGLATIIRNTAGAISALTGIVLVLPLVVQALPTSVYNDVERFLPYQIEEVMISGTPLHHSFAPWVGFTIVCGYAAFLLAVGALLLVRRDA